MSNFGLYGCMRMHQPTDIHSRDLIYIYNAPKHTHSGAGERGDLEVWVCVVYGGQ